MKKLGFILTLLVAIITFQPQVIHAASSVRDDASVLSTETIQQINQLHSEQFGSLYGKPEYAVVILNSLEGKSIENATQELFDEYGFGNPEYNNGLVFVFALEDREFRLGYGDGFAPIFYHLAEEDIVDEKAKSLLRATNYDDAILYISNHVYELVVQADQDSGLATIYAEGPSYTEKIKAQQEADKHSILLTLASIFGTIILAIIGFFATRRSMIRKRLLKSDLFPRWITEDPVFQPHELVTWGSKNKHRFHAFKTPKDRLAGSKAYLVEIFFPKKLTSVVLSAHNREILQLAMENDEVQLYFAEQTLTDAQFTLDTFAKQIQMAMNELIDYTSYTATQISLQIENYDLTDDVLEENQLYIPEYKEQLAKIVTQEIDNLYGNYLAQVMLETRTWHDIEIQINRTIATSILYNKEEALFTIDLEKLYQKHPELKQQLTDFEEEDRQTIFDNTRKEYYRSNTYTDSLVLFSVLNTHMSHQQEIVDSRNHSSSSSSFGGFSGGSSSGGGISGGW
ncbi:TPM domain-containing protein [Enterococcus saccharolyticus]|uniref:TPM domain-containing protein n=1 Tax=Candidatus Enterococcus willemsii TaxID=1857215 RepID=A0ABQ6Z177_9ENTE|nr:MULTISPECIES: TPM domain-containing protein [Enterococcus]KAF1304597.1 hypothetical protein BAU17_10370 [Enterococcus sp. CU12B]MCD5001332.1 TPM domain-containing protein [Enterococcus saccharolyticus]